MAACSNTNTNTNVNLNDDEEEEEEKVDTTLTTTTTTTTKTVVKINQQYNTIEYDEYESYDDDLDGDVNEDDDDEDIDEDDGDDDDDDDDDNDEDEDYTNYNSKIDKNNNVNNANANSDTNTIPTTVGAAALFGVSSSSSTVNNSELSAGVKTGNATAVVTSMNNNSLMKKISPLEWVGHKVRRKAIRRHHLINVNSYKRGHKTEWTENAKLGAHIFYDLPSTTNYSCYLNDSDVMTFHGLNIRCNASAKNERKKRCYLCRVVVHESCGDVVQSEIKCRFTYREASNAKHIEKKEQLKVQHHWLCRKLDDESINNSNKCQSCQRGFTNRFGLQTSANRTIVSCSWCKAAIHLRCFADSNRNQECRFGEFSDLMIPPHWIIKLAKKNSLRSTPLYKPMRRSFKRISQHQQQQSQPQQSCTSSQQQSQPQQSCTSSQQQTAQQQMQHHTVITPYQHSTRSFIVRPSYLNLNIKPLLVLINPKSGGNLGNKLLKKFMWLLNPRQIFDLSQLGNPKFALELYRNTPNLRLLVGGGDGTVGWVLSVIDQINFISSPPAVAVLPLGTGNDLSRVLNWGSAYTDEPLTKILSKMLDSRCVKLDRWKIYTEPNNEIDYDVDTNVSNSLSSISNNNANQGCDKLKNDVMNNYFSIGADAHVSLEFHERREANPEKFTSRWINLLQYVEAGGRDQIKKTWKDLTEFLQLECDGKDYTNEIKRRSYHCIIFLNIPKYSSGTNPWGTSNNDVWSVPAIDDGRLEVIGCFTSTLAKIQIGGAGERICQARHIKLTTSVVIPIQIDGEPSRLNPSVIEIKHKNQALMLERVKLRSSKNLQRCFEIKCIQLKDYKMCRKENLDNGEFKSIAKSFGKICIINLNENLNVMRGYIENYLKNNAEVGTPKKWSFLNAEGFYRVQDESDDCVEDIACENEIYILDESASFDENSFCTNQNSMGNKNSNLNSNSNVASNLSEVETSVMSNEDFEISAFTSSFNELIDATVKGNFKLIKQIDNLKQTDKNGMSALHYASSYGHKDIVKYLLERVPLSFINLTENVNKQTALHLAALKRRRAITKMLLKAGADPNLRDRTGESVFTLAYSRNDKDLKKLLKPYENIESTL